MTLPEVLLAPGGRRGPDGRPSRERLLRHSLLALLVVIVGLTGGILVIASRGARDEARQYRAAPSCSLAPRAPDCVRLIPGSVVYTRDSHSVLGARTTGIGISAGGSSTLDEEVQTTPSWSCVEAGEPAEVKTWRGRVTAVYTTHGSFVTPANPTFADSAGLEAGVALLGIAVVVPAAALIDRRRDQRGATRVSLRAFLGSRALHLGAVAFLGAQAIDVVSSALGFDRNLIEANQAVAAVVRLVGPFGFLLTRVPAVGLVLIGLQRVPPRAALVVLWASAVLFTAVGAHNVVLILDHAATGPSAPSCPTMPLP